MQVDIDLIQQGPWTGYLLQSAIPESDVSRARLYGIHDDLHIRSLTDEPGHYEILGSPKTWLLAQLIQQQTVPVKLMNHMSESEIRGYYFPQLETSDHFIDRAFALQQMIQEQGISLAQAGRLTGKSRSEVCNMMRILKLDPLLLARIRKFPSVLFGHARILAGLTAGHQHKLLEQIISESLTVQQAEQAVKNSRVSNQNREPEAAAQSKSADIIRLENHLMEYLGARTELKEKEGLLVINYHQDLDILQGILDKIGVNVQ